MFRLVLLLESIRRQPYGWLLKGDGTLHVRPVSRSVSFGVRGEALPNTLVRMSAPIGWKRAQVSAGEAFIG